MPQNNQTMVVRHIMPEIAKSITLNVVISGYRSWIVRLKIATVLIRLAAKIAGMGIEIVNKDEINANENKGENLFIMDENKNVKE